MPGNVPEPPTMIFILVPEAGADKQDGAADSASPHFPATMRTRWYTLFGCRRSAARRPSRIKEDVLARIKEVRLTFPRRPQEAFPVWFVENGGDSASASYGLAAGNLVDLQTPNGRGNGEVEGGGSCVVVADVLR